MSTPPLSQPPPYNLELESKQTVFTYFLGKLPKIFVNYWFTENSSQREKCCIFFYAFLTEVKFVVSHKAKHQCTVAYTLSKCNKELSIHHVQESFCH